MGSSVLQEPAGGTGWCPHGTVHVDRRAVAPDGAGAHPGGWLLPGAIVALLGVFGALAIAWRPLVAAAACAALLASLFAARRPIDGLVLLMGLVALFGSDSIFHLRLGIQWVEADLILGVCGLGWSVGTLLRGAPIRLSRLDVAVILFALAVVAGIHRGLSLGIPLEEMRTELRPPAYLILIYAIARTSIRSPRIAGRVLAILLFVGLAAAIKGLCVYALVPSVAPGAPERLIAATRVMNSDGFKRVLVQGGEIFPVISALLLLPWIAVVRSRRARIGSWLALSILLLTILISFTRSYWLGFLAGSAAVLFAMPARAGRIFLGGIVVATVLVLSLAALVETTGREISSTGFCGQVIHRIAGIDPDDPDPSVRGRLAEIEGIKERIASSPWTGTGLGGTYSFYSALTNGVKEWEYTHNSYASVALKLGIFGLAAILLACGWGLAAAYGWLAAARPSPPEAALASGALAALLAILVISFTAPWLTHYVGSAWAGLLMGCSESMRLHHRETRPRAAA